jgi:acetolactate synthase-1/2/3 large subunit
MMTQKIRLADCIVSTLKAYGVKHFFLLVGGNAMHLNDAVLKSGISYTVFHHEQAAVMAAEAFARINNTIGCIIVTSGPGATNTLTGIAGAFLDASPIIVLSGQPKSTELKNNKMPYGVRQIGTFEVDFATLASSICLYSRTIVEATMGPTILKEAISAVSGPRPGPALIEIPIDVQGEEVNWPGVVDLPDDPSVSGHGREIESFLFKFQDELRTSKRPLIAVGHGVRVGGVVPALQKIIARAGIPVVTTQLAKDFLPYDHLNFVGHFGIRGDRTANVAIQSADLILFLGTSLHQQNTGYEQELFAPDAIKYIVELDKSVSGKSMAIKAEYLDCDLRIFVQEFSKSNFDRVEKNSEWLQSLINLKEKLAVRNEPHKSQKSRINLYHFVDALSETLSGNENVITDAGLCFYVMGQAFKLKGNQRYIVSGGLGSMGYALPAGIGSSIDANSVTVVVTGDGSMQTNVQELATLMNLGSEVKIFVINNEGYASIRNTQRSFFGEPFIGTSEDSGLSMPDWRLISAAYGVPFSRISTADSLEAQLSNVLKMKGPVLIEVMCHIDQEIMPGVGNYRDKDGALHSNPLHEMIPSLDNIQKNFGLVIN